MTNDDRTAPERADEGTTEGTAETGAMASELEEQLQTAQAEVEKLKDRYLRSAAEMDNYRKRVTREREQQQQRLTMDLVRQLLPVVDDFELALAHVPDEYQQLPWIEGITLIHQKLANYLRTLGVHPIQAEGQRFDPHYHEALTTEPSDEHEEGMVSEDIRTGYMLGDQVLRPTLVKVSRGAGQE